MFRHEILLLRILHDLSFHFAEVARILFPGLVEVDLFERVHEVGDRDLLFVLALGRSCCLHNDIINIKS